LKSLSFYPAWGVTTGLAADTQLTLRSKPSGWFFSECRWRVIGSTACETLLVPIH